MQDVDGFGAPSQIDHPLSAAVVRYADLLYTLAHGAQRFEIVGLRSTLYFVQLITRVVPRVLGKVPQALERVSAEPHWPHVLIISDWI
jgi:hypothetical protein